MPQIMRNRSTDWREGMIAPVVPAHALMRVRAATLAQQRRQRGLMQIEIAAALDVSQPTYSKLETPRRAMYISQSLAERLAAVLLGDAARWRELVDEHDRENDLGRLVALERAQTEQQSARA